MFEEWVNVRQASGEPPRRWFQAAGLELVVWCDLAGAPVGFQLFYENERESCALSLLPDGGYVHGMVDEGGDRGGKFKATPILIPSEKRIHARSVMEMFERHRNSLPIEFAAFVSRHLEQRWGQDNSIPSS